MKSKEQSTIIGILYHDYLLHNALADLLTKLIVPLESTHADLFPPKMSKYLAARCVDLQVQCLERSRTASTLYLSMICPELAQSEKRRYDPYKDFIADLESNQKEDPWFDSPINNFYQKPRYFDSNGNFIQH